MATRTCPSCGAPDYGISFCVSCQTSMSGNLAVTLEAGTTHLAAESTVINADVTKAGFFRRFTAFAIDWLTLSIIADIVRFTYRIGSGSDPGMGHLDVAIVLSTVLFILYFTLLTGEGGQTLGKMLLGIRVQGIDGSTVGYGRSFIRALGYPLSMFFMTFLGFLWALWDKKNQAWHDKIAGTVVVKV
jgi:uncharacterized RDD family membrane protein YckC